jgi:tripartite-type tricarboxylate transporter receptor subunit TctC
MKPRRIAVAAVPLILLVAACGDDGNGDSTTAEAEEDYPTETTNWIVPFAAGGGADASFRVFQ